MSGNDNELVLIKKLMDAVESLARNNESVESKLEIAMHLLDQTSDTLAHLLLLRSMAEKVKDKEITYSVSPESGGWVVYINDAPNGIEDDIATHESFCAAIYLASVAEAGRDWTTAEIERLKMGAII